MDKDILAFSATHIGYNHEQVNKVCEDASDYYEDDRMYICVVADGHGSDNYPRTDRGARYAVDAAIKCICEFIENAIPEQVNNDEKQGYSLLTQLSKSILREWYQRVEDNYNQNPIDKSELTNVSDRYKKVYLSSDKDSRKIEKAYGCTLIAVALTSEYSFGLQIGDGRCVVVDQYGDFSEPIPWDEDCQLNVTTSICDSDAIDEFRFCILQRMPVAIFCGTDGIDDSYSNSEELYALYRSILDVFAEHGPETGKREIREYLPILTKKGCGDDVSIACIMDYAKIKEIAPLIKIDSQLFNLSIDLVSKKNKLETISEKMELAFRKIQNNSEIAEKAQKIRQDFNELLDQFYRLKEEIPLDEKKIEALKNQKQELLYDQEVASFEEESQASEVEELGDKVICSEDYGAAIERIETKESITLEELTISDDSDKKKEDSNGVVISENAVDRTEIEELSVDNCDNSTHEVKEQEIIEHSDNQELVGDESNYDCSSVKGT